MGLKKYEIITVGSNKRVRALRSWQVGDRYVNIGDVGGIVYDEKTLSQDGLCWLFRGNFGFPGARIGGDSIVDVGEATLSTKGTPAVDILGSSVVVGSKLQFATDQTAADAVVLTADDFEQGGYGAIISGNPLPLFDTTQYVRPKNLFFAGGKTVTLKCEVPGYTVTAVAVDRDGNIITNSPTTSSGVGVTITVPAGQYFTFRMSKDPTATITPAEAGLAQITFTGNYETKLSIIDSRVEINPANATGTATIVPGGIYAISPGANYPEAIIRNSKVSMNVPASTNRIFRLMGQVIGSTATLDATAGPVVLAGIYSNVKSLMASGVLDSSTGVNAYNLIQATDCDNFAVSPTIFPGLATARVANTPFIFQGCNVPGGKFYHHAQIANTYKNIDFALAQADLGKTVGSIAGRILASSEIEGMYRIFAGTVSFGALVESYDSVRSLTLPDVTGSITTTYGTTIYKDAYINGLFAMAGTNVFGSKAPSHPLAQVLNVAPRAVQGTFNATTIGETITGVTTSTTRVCVPVPFRVNGSKGLTMNFPTGFGGAIICTDIKGVITSNTGWVTAETSLSTSVQLQSHFAYVLVGKVGDAAITPADLAGVTVTVYNGCKIVNTGATAVNMKGSIRVEDNATLVNASVTGTGYFGSNSVVYYNPAVWASLDVNGTVHMKDNAVFAPTALRGSCTLVHMQDNAKFIGSVTAINTGLSFIMAHNAIIEGVSNTRSGVVMYGNSKVTATGQITAACRGVLVMQDNASIEADTTVIGAITLAGNYKGNVVKTWTGKRTITDVNEPEYDNNVKSKYDL